MKFSSITGLLAFAVLAVAFPAAAELTCESLGADNAICISEVGPSHAVVAAPVASKNETPSLSFLTALDLGGGALDLENQFASDTVFDDATEIVSVLSVPDRTTQKFAPMLSANNRIRAVELHMSTVSVSRGGFVVGVAEASAGKK